MSIALLLLTAAAVLVSLWYFIRKSKNLNNKTQAQLPSGPMAWPLIGNLDILASSRRHEKLQSAGRRFGGIFTIKLGAIKYVWITSHKYFREALLNQTWEFNDRPHQFWMKDDTTDRYPGILSSGVDNAGRTMRLFIRASLRSFNLGRQNMQDTILQECRDINEVFSSMKDKPFQPRSVIAHAATNIIASITVGQTFKQGDDGLRLLNEILTSGVKQLINAQRDKIFPILRYVPLQSRRILYASFQTGKQFLVDIVDSHLESRLSGEPRDFVDSWLDEAEKEQDSGETFAFGRLPNVLVDLFSGGFETVTTTIQWSFAMLLHHPDVQKRVHDEIDEIIGRGLQITLDDQTAIPYTNAVILETLRMFPPAPFAVPHMCTKDAMLGNYCIPQGTRIMFHLYSIQHDPELWDSPEDFHPERFLHNGGIRIPDAFVAFGAGSRPCIGEELGKKELFLLFSNILQRFRILLPPGERLPSLDLMQGAVLYPRPFTIVVEER